MISLQTLCETISLQPQVQEQVLTCAQTLDFDALQPALDGLLFPNQWTTSRNQLKDALSPDPSGIKILTCMLHCSCISQANYTARGIPQNIFIDTFRCFPRFIGEHQVSYGHYAFDRDWWTARQISLSLFRLGTLEYELTTHQGSPVISIHIPSDADLAPSALCHSHQMAKEFFASHFPHYAQANYMCHSWMLEPLLGQLLPQQSKILAFGRAFSIQQVDYGEKDFMEWIFKNPKLPLPQLPEHTSLQRAIKAHLLAGGDVGEALGWLSPHGFS